MQNMEALLSKQSQLLVSFDTEEYYSFEMGFPRVCCEETEFKVTLHLMKKMT